MIITEQKLKEIWMKRDPKMFGEIANKNPKRLQKVNREGVNEVRQELRNLNALGLKCREKIERIRLFIIQIFYLQQILSLPVPKDYRLILIVLLVIILH